MKSDGLVRVAVSFVGFAKATTHSLSPHYGNRAIASGFLDPVKQSLNTLYASVDASVLKELRGIYFNHRDLLFGNFQMDNSEHSKEQQQGERLDSSGHF